MKKGVAIVEFVIIIIVIVMAVFVVMNRSAAKKEIDIQKEAKVSIEAIRNLLENYKVTVGSSQYPVSDKVNSLVVKLDKGQASGILQVIDGINSAYLSDSLSYTLIVASKTKNRKYYWTNEYSSIIYEGVTSPISLK